MKDYLPPDSDRSLELEALQRTARSVVTHGISHPDDIRETHASNLRLLIFRRERKNAATQRVLDALGMGADS